MKKKPQTFWSQNINNISGIKPASDFINLKRQRFWTSFSNKEKYENIVNIDYSRVVNSLSSFIHFIPM